MTIQVFSSRRQSTKADILCCESSYQSAFEDHVSSCSMNDEHSNVQSQENNKTQFNDNTFSQVRFYWIFYLQNYCVEIKKVRKRNTKSRQTKERSLFPSSNDEEGCREHATSCPNDQKSFLTQSPSNLNDDKYFSQVMYYKSY